VTGLAAALWTEVLKAHRSKLPWLMGLGFSLAPLVGGLFMMILKDPQWARRFGLITTKAQIRAGTADWPTYFGLLAQAVAIGGLIVFGLVAIWVFGREYGDRTVTDLLALPTPRGAIVAAKFIVIASWSAGLTVLVYALGLGLGAAIGLPGWSTGLAADAASRLAATAGLTIALVSPFAWAASAGRGYLPPIGGMLLTLFLAQVIAALGWGAYFPWSVPALASGVAGPGAQHVGTSSYLLVGLTGVAGIAGTVVWWRFADQT
jgi:ABC-2 type transport system permease protein